MKHQRQISAAAPDWTCSDSECDVTDNFIDEVDPENEMGAYVTAYFSHADGVASNERHEDVTVTNAQLEGICVEHTDGRSYFDRAVCLSTILGYEAVCRIEEFQGADA